MADISVGVGGRTLARRRGAGVRTRGEPGGEGEDDEGRDEEHGQEAGHEVHPRLEEGHHPASTRAPRAVCAGVRPARTRAGGRTRETGCEGALAGSSIEHTRAELGRVVCCAWGVCVGGPSWVRGRCC